MSAFLLPLPAASPVARLVERAHAYAASAKSEATRQAYARDWQAFEAWCGDRQLRALPASPATVAIYVADLADTGRKVATIDRALVAISQAHKLARHDSPRSGAAVQEVMKGIRRRLGTAQAQKSPILVEGLRGMAAQLPEGLLGKRDRALLCLGFAGALRRSELVGLDVADLAFTAEGIEITLRRSKTDQEGQGRKIGIPYGRSPATCPVRAVKHWLDAIQGAQGPLLRRVDRWGNVGPRLTAKAVALVVKRYAAASGLSAANYAGHSLRAGLATAAAKVGKSERAIMAQTGHRSVTMVRRYIRDASLFRENAAAGIGL